METELPHFRATTVTVLIRITMQTSSWPGASVHLAPFKPYFLDEACPKAAVPECTTAIVILGTSILHLTSLQARPLSTIEHLTTELCVRHCYLYHLDDETVAQRVYINCPRLHSQVRAGTSRVKACIPLSHSSAV